MSRKFVTQREIDFINRINKELIQSWIGQEVVYYAISVEHSQLNELYGESVVKTWYNPIRLNALVRYDQLETTSTSLGLDSKYSLEVYFHNLELTERNVAPKEGDFIEFGQVVFEITSVTQPQMMLGQINNKMMTKCACTPSREGQFKVNNNVEQGIDNTHPLSNRVPDDGGTGHPEFVYTDQQPSSAPSSAGTPAYTDATRPDASSVDPGTMIFNINDSAPNWSDGTSWRDADGNVT